MKKTFLILMICCLVICVSCFERGNGRGGFDLSNAKNLYIGKVGAARGSGSDEFGEVTKDNDVKNVSFDFPIAKQSGYTSLPDRIYQLNEDYILVRFGMPLILVRTSDGYGICLNHIKWRSHSHMELFDGSALKRQFKINENGDVFYIGRYLNSKMDNKNNMSGFTIMKYDRANNELVNFYTYDSGKLRGETPYDSILVDSFENIAAVSNDQINNGKDSMIVAVPRNGQAIYNEYPVSFYSSFVGDDGVFYFLSNYSYVSVVFNLAGTSADLSNLKSYDDFIPISEEYVVINGKVYGLSKGAVIYISAENGQISDFQYLDTGLSSIYCWDYAGDYIYISGDDKLIKIDTADNSVSDVITDKRIESFTASEEHGITFETKDDSSYSLWVMNLISEAMTKIQESTEAFQDLVKVD